MLTACGGSGPPLSGLRNTTAATATTRGAGVSTTRGEGPLTSRDGATHKVFRLSSRNVPACGACRGHAANKVFLTEDAAGGNRAHKGCNCSVVAQNLSQADFAKFFSQPGVLVYDIRG